MNFKKIETGIYKAEGKNIWAVKCKRYNNEWTVGRMVDGAEPSGWPACDDDNWEEIFAFGKTKAEAVKMAGI